MKTARGPSVEMLSPPAAEPIPKRIVANLINRSPRRPLPERGGRILGPKFIPAAPDPSVNRIVTNRLPRSTRYPSRPHSRAIRMVAPVVCRLNFVLTVRTPIDFVLEPPHATLGREPLDFVIVNCRNEA